MKGSPYKYIGILYRVTVLLLVALTVALTGILYSGVILL